jgi:hypothetical protein
MYWAGVYGGLGVLSYIGGWGVQAKGVALCIGSGGSFSWAGTLLILGGEGMKVWGGLEFGRSVENFRLAMAVPDGTDANRLGNAAVLAAQGLGMKESNSQIVGLIASIILSGPSIGKAGLSDSSIKLLKALIESSAITKDIKDIFEAIIKEHTNSQQNNNNNQNDENNDDEDEDDNDKYGEDNSWFQGWSAEN